MSFELLIALRYLRARRRQAFISLISLLSMAGVGLGVCALIVVLSVMGGFEQQLKAKILGINSHVMLFSLGEPITNPGPLTTRALEDKEVAAASPFVWGQIMLVAPGGAAGAIARGVPMPQALSVFDLEGIMVQGRAQDLGIQGADLPGVILGRALARQLGVSRGSVVNLVNPLGEDSPVGRVPVSEPFVVLGLFDSGMHQYDSSLCYISLAKAQELMGLGKAVSGLELKVNDIYQADQIGQRVSRALGPTFYARDWMTNNKSLFAALKLERVTMFVILTLIVLVAAFGIVSSLIMLVMEKTKDIAILKTMGATGRSVGAIFLLEGLIIGGMGTLLGLGGGISLCALLARYQFIKLPADVYPMNTLPVMVDPVTTGLVALCAVALSLLATIYPSRAAARMDPVAALRYE